MCFPIHAFIKLHEPKRYYLFARYLLQCLDPFTSFFMALYLANAIEFANGGAQNNTVS
jgi:hypothetical protein